MSLFTLYLLTRFNSFGCYLFFLSIVGLLFSIITLISSLIILEANDSRDEGFINIFSWFKKCAISTALLGFVTSAIPSNKDAYMIMGGYYATNYIANSPAAKQLPDNILNAANSFLKEYAADSAKEAIKDTKAAIKDAKDALK